MESVIWCASKQIINLQHRQLKNRNNSIKIQTLYTVQQLEAIVHMKIC